MNENINVNKKIGANIFNARKKLHMSRAELGKKVNLHESTVKRYEDGQIKSLDIEKLKEFADALEINIINLLNWENEFNNILNIFKEVYSKNKNNEYYQLNCNYKELFSECFNVLNSLGKREALKRIKELTFVPEYQKYNIDTIAAHNDYTNNKDELDKINEDINDMKNWD